MIEKRKDIRMKADLKLNVSSLFKQNNIMITDVDSPIEVLDVSKSGIGFNSSSILPLGFYFNAALQLGSEEETLFCVLKIVRCEPISDKKYNYGSEFIGLAPILDYIFDDYAQELANDTSKES